MTGLSIVDLRQSDQAAFSVRCDVCVIGGGAAGLYLVNRLAAQGVDVVLVEAGGQTCEGVEEIGFDPTFAVDEYRGATLGRAFGLGGSTLRWGGLLIPHSEHDVPCDAERHSDVWSHVVQTVRDRSRDVLGVLGYPGSPGFESFAVEELGESARMLQRGGLDAAASLFLPVRRKNLGFLLRACAKRARVRVFVRAVAKSWSFSPMGGDARTSRLTAVSETGNRLEVTAREYVIAAGAVESARMLLELEAVSSGILPADAAVGHYLGDHLSVSIADVAPASRDLAARLFAPRFAGPWMRTIRFVPRELGNGAPRCFGHFIFENESDGFLLAKETLSAIQAKRLPSLTASGVMSGLGGLGALAYARFFRHALYIPPGSKSHLQVDVEQVPSRENRVALGDDSDRYGRRTARIHWRIGQADFENLGNVASTFLRSWHEGGRQLPVLAPRTLEFAVNKPHDAYHPCGTCRMGNDGEAVVDTTLRVRGTANMWLVSTGNLPSAGTANPTFSMLCLADSLAHRLTNENRDAQES